MRRQVIDYIFTALLISLVACASDIYPDNDDDNIGADGSDSDSGAPNDEIDDDDEPSDDDDDGEPSDDDDDGEPSDDDDEDDPSDDEAPFEGRQLESKAQGDGEVWVEVNATNGEAWIYVDLDTGSQVEPEDPENSLDWDMAFQRFNIKINGGIHGVGEVEVAPIETSDFDSVQEIPDEGWIVDEEDGPDDNSNPDYAISSIAQWYDYDIRFHTLSPRDLVYVIYSTDQEFSKIQIQDYYDDAGTSGFLSFLWKPLDEVGAD